MLDPEQIKNERSITGKQILLCVLLVILINAGLFCTVEYYLSYPVIDSTAEVISKEVSSPVNVDDEPFLLVIKRDTKIYHVRVPIEYYRQLREGDMVLLVDTRSGILKRNLKTRLFDYPVYLKQSVVTPIVPQKANKDKVWSWNSASYFLLPGGQV